MLLGHYPGRQSVCLVSKLPYLGSTETGTDALGAAPPFSVYIYMDISRGWPS